MILINNNKFLNKDAYKINVRNEQIYSNSSIKNKRQLNEYIKRKIIKKIIKI